MTTPASMLFAQYYLSPEVFNMRYVRLPDVDIRTDVGAVLQQHYVHSRRTFTSSSTVGRTTDWTIQLYFNIQVKKSALAAKKKEQKKD